MRVLLIPILFVLVACADLYYPEPVDGMTLNIHVYDNWDELSAACNGHNACAIRRGMTCDIHLPERAGQTWDHEFTHCFGRQDAPVYARNY